MKTIYLFLIFIFYYPLSLFASDFIDKSDLEFKKGNIEKADYYLARHFTSKNLNKDKISNSINARKLKPFYFISGKYSNEFLSFFFANPFYEWRSQIKNDENLVVLTKEVYDEKSKQYSVVWSQPQLTTWSIIHSKKKAEKTHMLGVAKANVVIGKLINDRPKPCNRIDLKGPIQYIYPPKFEDIDNDNILEFIIKANYLVADGYLQILEIYKSTNKKDLCNTKLYKSFIGRNGYVIYKNQMITKSFQTSKDNEGVLAASLQTVKKIKIINDKEVEMSEEVLPNFLTTKNIGYLYDQ